MTGREDLGGGLGSLLLVQIYTEGGVKSSSQLIITDPYLIRMQQIYDSAAEDLNNQLGPIDYSPTKTSIEMIQKAADRQIQIEKKQGVSPIQQIQRDFLMNPAKYKETSTETTIIPEFGRGEP